MMRQRDGRSNAAVSYVAVNGSSEVNGADKLGKQLYEDTTTPQASSEPHGDSAEGVQAGTELENGSSAISEKTIAQVVTTLRAASASKRRLEIGKEELGLPANCSQGTYAAELALSKSVAELLSNWETLLEQAKTREDGLVATIKVPVHQLSFANYSGWNNMSRLVETAYATAATVGSGIVSCLGLGPSSGDLLAVLGLTGMAISGVAAFNLSLDTLLEWVALPTGDSTDSRFNRAFRDPDPTTSTSPSLSVLTKFLARAGAKIEWDMSERTARNERITKAKIVLI